MYPAVGSSAATYFIILCYLFIAAATTAYQGYFDIMIFTELLLVEDMGGDLAW